MPATLHVTSEDDTGNNNHLDALLVIRAIMAFDSDSAPTEAQVEAFSVSPHRFIHIEASPPVDAAQPEETVVMFGELGPPAKLMFKVKGSTGVVKIGSISLT